MARLSLRSLAGPVLVVLASAAAVGWLVLSKPDETAGRHVRLTDTSSKGTPARQPENTVSPTAGATAARQVPLPSQIRNVSPEGVSTPAVTGSLKRVAPSDTYQNLLNPPIEPVPDGPLDIRRPQVINAGLLKTDDLTIRLAGIEPLAADETCLSRLGGTWPCGARARTSLRGLVRMFAITCEKQAETGPREITAVCTRRSINLGEWLVEHGWARASGTAPAHYHELEAQAKERKIGQWQSEWIGLLDQPVAGTTVPPGADLPPDIAEFLGETGESLLDGSFSSPFDLPDPAEDNAATGNEPENTAPLSGAGTAAAQRPGNTLPETGGYQTGSPLY
ncbi:thermonuclease family protein [Roseibium sp. RKSG952]|uniref:thermonuclease family protein n=1 Tax=Roseibium sp. RKSG952 TaxID=2529384 RepID=UPI0012BD33B0|nr:thermonuclease family protein [Roseibium sp. RKSG952]MTI00244.1 thermonuclease family protein [Roseibium sp. RKSG952]